LINGQASSDALGGGRVGPPPALHLVDISQQLEAEAHAESESLAWSRAWLENGHPVVADVARWAWRELLAVLRRRSAQHVAALERVHGLA
jgi:hypothetical protein